MVGAVAFIVVVAALCYFLNSDNDYPNDEWWDEWDDG